MPLVLADFRDQNAFTVLGTMGRLLKEMTRQTGLKEDGKRLDEAYQEKATAGDYEHLLATTEEYALKYLATTLEAREGDLTAGAFEEA